MAKLFKVMSVRMPLDTLVGIYDYLQSSGFDTKGVAYSTAIQNFCRGMVEGARLHDQIQARVGSDLMVALQEMRGEVSIEMSTDKPQHFHLPEHSLSDESTQSMEERIEDAMSEVLGSGDQIDSVAITSEPDSSPLITETEEVAPWHGLDECDTQMVETWASKVILKEYNQGDEMYDKAVRITLGSIDRDIWDKSSSTLPMIKHLYDKFKMWAMEHDTKT